MRKLHGPVEMDAEATRFIHGLSPRADRATVVAMHGDLGAGKTTFVKGVAKALGVEEHVTSPTFVIEKIYPLEHPFFDNLIHMDAYRLKGPQHLRVLAWDEALANPGNLIFVEWPEQVGDALPHDALHISLRYSDEGTREITYGQTTTESKE